MSVIGNYSQRIRGILKMMDVISAVVNDTWHKFQNGFIPDGIATEKYPHACSNSIELDVLKQDHSK